MVKEPIDDIIKRYKRFAIRDVALSYALLVCGFVVIGLVVGFIFLCFQMPQNSGLGQLLANIRTMFEFPPEGYPPEVLVSKKAWMIYLFFGGILPIIYVIAEGRDNLAALNWLKEQAMQFPSEESVKSVANILLRNCGYLNREASAELLAHAGDNGLSFLVEFLSPNFTRNDLAVAVVAAHSLGCIGTASAQAHLEKCAMEVDALQERLLAGESDRSNHHSIKEEIKKYQAAVQKALEQARTQST